MAKQVAPENVVGRDKLIRRMWKAIERGSAVFTAERRIGKTTVLTKMEAEPPDGKIVLYADLEKVDTPVRFVEVLLTDLNRYLPAKAILGQWLGKFLESIGDVEVGGIIRIPPQEKKGWQSILEKALANACSNQSAAQFVFLWDEVPYMLQKISALERKSGSNDNSALAILDSLRAMRNENPNLRMVFTGSVGLHHVLTDLRGNRYASQPTNDMEEIEIGPLAPEYASTLARDLLAREEIRCNSEDSVVERLVELTDGVPFYIHRVVTRMALADEVATPATVDAEIMRQFTNTSDPWKMEHFRGRLTIYYRGRLMDADGKRVKRASLAKSLLNHLAVATEPQSIDQCNADLKSRTRFENRDAVVELLTSLAMDHYLTRDDDGRYRFRFPLIQKWWILAEGLNG
ncbi:MAG: hypothetical protein HQ582_15325 [Planctomycetes bacterium]|nr:hypothetical protein [Planctomycetota bacterium]